MNQNIKFDNDAAAWSDGKYVTFNYSFLIFDLRIKVTLSKKTNQLNLTVMWLYKVVPNIRRIEFSSAAALKQICGI